MAQSNSKLLRDGLSSFSATEKRVAHRLLSDYPLAGLQSATELARAVGVSTPTVLRLVGKLGYSSYLDFQRDMREELASQRRSPLSKHALEIEDDSDALSAPRRFADAVQANIQDTFRQLLGDEFLAAAKLLSDPRAKVHLIGGRFTDALALYLSVQLRILRPQVNHLQEQESNWRDQLLDMSKRDVLVIYDIRRYQANLLRLAEAAAARQVKIILLTDQWLSPIARVASHVLTARIAVPSIWDSSAALMTLSEALLADVYRLGGEHSQKRIRELEQMHGNG